MGIKSDRSSKKSDINNNEGQMREISETELISINIQMLNDAGTQRRVLIRKPTRKVVKGNNAVEMWTRW
ncbi:hypothetical protein K458DRAFT_79516 [Lentithecium fluviatile CBS 122367]|uniref:Uncharacterized protein n=1 Tax=Lentithecium fluviatile CBS 122367 TaxID=1168545 RepID=A0A6G1IUX4_9PLEO|nr:hypothetical protein K458DRAFT_79516 [Lentithecium fluviatile CBS 122367]